MCIRDRDRRQPDDLSGGLRTTWSFSPSDKRRRVLTCCDFHNMCKKYPEGREEKNSNPAPGNSPAFSGTGTGKDLSLIHI